MADFCLTEIPSLLIAHKQLANVALTQHFESARQGEARQGSFLGE